MANILSLHLLTRLETLAQVWGPSGSCRAGSVFLLETSSHKHWALAQSNSWGLILSLWFILWYIQLVNIIYVQSWFGSLHVRDQYLHVCGCNTGVGTVLYLASCHSNSRNYSPLHHSCPVFGLQLLLYVSTPTYYICNSLWARSAIQGRGTETARVLLPNVDAMSSGSVAQLSV